MVDEWVIRRSDCTIVHRTGLSILFGEVEPGGVWEGLVLHQPQDIPDHELVDLIDRAGVEYRAYISSLS